MIKYFDIGVWIAFPPMYWCRWKSCQPFCKKLLTAVRAISWFTDTYIISNHGVNYPWRNLHVSFLKCTIMSLNIMLAAAVLNCSDTMRSQWTHAPLETPNGHIIYQQLYALCARTVPHWWRICANVHFATNINDGINKGWVLYLIQCHSNKKI